jgi:hypothetical protein
MLSTEGHRYTKPIGPTDVSMAVCGTAIGKKGDERCNLT